MTVESVKSHLHLTILCIVAALALLAVGGVAAARDVAPAPVVATEDTPGTAPATSTDSTPAETGTPEPTPEETPEPEPTPEGTPDPGLTPEETPGSTDTPEVGPTSPPTETSGPEEPEEEPTPEAPVTPEVEASPTPTPTPTPTPRRVPSIWATAVPGAEQLAPASEPTSEPPQLTAEEWLRLLLSILIVLVVAILGSKAIYRVLQWVIERDLLGIDDTWLGILRPLIGWWLAAIGFHVAIQWVNTQDEAAKQLLENLVFLFYLGVSTLTAWRLVDYAVDLYIERAAPEADDATLEKVSPIVRRFVRAALLVLSVTIALGRLNADLSCIVAVVGIGGLALTLAMEDTIADIIAGFTILVDQPFRVGDRIEIEEIGTWGDVVAIGLRTTDIRTRDNRMVIVPNSIIGKNQVVNYTYPDPQYRIQTHVEIAYGSDIETARLILVEAVRHVEGVLPDKPVEALYVEMGASAMIFCVRWWIESYTDTRYVIDQVHTALQIALDEAGIESPFPTQNLKMRFTGQSPAEFQDGSSTPEQ